MADPVGFISCILTLLALTLQSASFLINEIETFQSLPRDVRELLTELLSLKLVLKKLSELGDLSLDIDLSALTLTLEQCKKACDDVKKELLRCCPRSSSDRTSFRDWLKLKCGGGDGIEGFRKQLIGYKSIITVALSFANLRATANSAEAIQACRDSIATTTIDLQAYLENIQQKLEILTSHSTASADPYPAARRHMEEEQRTTEKALQFCTLLSQHIEQVHVDFFNDRNGPQHDQDLSSSSEMLFGKGLDGCKEHICFTRAQLEKRHQRLSERLHTNSTAVSAETQASLDTLKREAKTLRCGLDFFSDVDSYLESQISNIENHAEGNDMIQIMVSTNGKTINGRNHGNGDRAMQAGGQWGEASLQQVSQDFKSIALHHTSFREHGNKLPAAAAGGEYGTAGFKSPAGNRRQSGFVLGGRPASAGAAGIADGSSSGSRQREGDEGDAATSTRATGAAAGSAVNRRRI